MQKSGANKKPRKMSEDAIARNLERSTYTCNDAERQKKWRIKHKKCLLNDEFLDRYDDAQKNTFWKYFDKETLTTLNRALRIHGKDKTKTVWNNSDFDKIVGSFYQEPIYESPYWTGFEPLHSVALAWYNIHLDEVLRDARQEILDHSLSLEKSTRIVK
ncbi:MAG: hypothetical protein ACI4JC_07635 [Faecalibacterium sp.]